MKYHRFRTGDTVKRTGNYFGRVKTGDINIVFRTGKTSVYFEEDRMGYDAAAFELIDAKEQEYEIY